VAGGPGRWRPAARVALAVRTTASGHAAWAPARTRSARPACPPPVTSSAANHTSRHSSTPAAPTDTRGRSPQGTEGPRRWLPAGQAVRAMKPAVAQNACGSEPPPLAGSGFAATSMPATPPAISMSRPAEVAGLNASPVKTSQAPTPRSATVITHRSVAPCAARALMVLATASKEPGWSPAATVHPPTNSMGATADESTPHHGTLGTTTTVSETQLPPGTPPMAAGRRAFRRSGLPPCERAIRHAKPIVRLARLTPRAEGPNGECGLASDNGLKDEPGGAGRFPLVRDPLRPESGRGLLHVVRWCSRVDST
jgi:hypothetical protein